MISMRIGLALIVCTVVSWLSPRHAQAQVLSANYGIGMSPALQACPYGLRAGAGAYDSNDEVEGIREELAEKGQEYAKKKRELKLAEQGAKSAERLLGLYLTSEAVTTLREHISSASRCIDYKSNNQKGGKITNAPYTDVNWRQICKACKDADKVAAGTCPTEGDECAMKDLDRRACDAPEAKNSKVSAGSDRCYESLKKLADKTRDMKSLKDEVDRLDIEIKEIKERLKIARIEKKENEKTEGTYCVECGGYTYEPKTNWGAAAVTAGLGVADIFANYSSEQARRKENAINGWPTQQSYVSYLPGLLSILGGVYGAVSGGTGRGTFGCAQGIGGNGNWNIQGMNSPFLGGGLYYPGQNNMWGYPAADYNNPLASLYAQGLAPWAAGPNFGLAAGLQAGVAGGLGGLGGLAGLQAGAGLGLGAGAAVNPQLIEMQIQAQRQQAEAYLSLQQQQVQAQTQALQAQLEAQRQRSDLLIQRARLDAQLNSIQGGALGGGAFLSGGLNANISGGLAGTLGVGLANLLGTGITGAFGARAGQAYPGAYAGGSVSTGLGLNYNALGGGSTGLNYNQVNGIGPTGLLPNSNGYNNNGYINNPLITPGAGVGGRNR